MRSFGRKSIGKNLDSRCSLGDNLGVPVEGPHKPEHYRYQADSNLETRKANGEICSPFLALETDRKFSENQFVQTMEKYCRQALKLAEVTFLSEDEGFAARIPGFRGLIATGQTKREALAELETALADWIDLALKRGLGLPPVSTPPATDLVSAH